MFYIYSDPQSRFLAVTQDLWVTVTLAKLLSSKMSLTVCNPPKNFNLLTNEECTEWSMTDISEARQGHQLPVLTDINSGIEFKGPVPDLPGDLLKRYQTFILESYNILYAAWLTDASLNSSNSKFFEPFFDESLSPETVWDDSGVQGGFLNSVYQIIYFSSTVEEIKEKISLIFQNEKSSRLEILKLYKEKFYENLL